MEIINSKHAVDNYLEWELILLVAVILLVMVWSWQVYTYFYWRLRKSLESESCSNANKEIIDEEKTENMNKVSSKNSEVGVIELVFNRPVWELVRLKYIVNKRAYINTNINNSHDFITNYGKNSSKSHQKDLIKPMTSTREPQPTNEALSSSSGVEVSTYSSMSNKLENKAVVLRITVMSLLLTLIIVVTIVTLIVNVAIKSNDEMFKSNNVLFENKNNFKNHINISNINTNNSNSHFYNYTTITTILLTLIANLLLLTKMFFSFKEPALENSNNNLKEETENNYLNIRRVCVVSIKVIGDVLIVMGNPYYLGVVVISLVRNVRGDEEEKHVQVAESSATQNTTTHSTILNQSLLHLILFSTFITPIILFSTFHPYQNILTLHIHNSLFPTLFHPQSNLIWIFYSHMFNRYLSMYQLVFFFLAIVIVVSLSLLKINFETKFICAHFVAIFLSYYCSNVEIFVFWVAAFLSLQNSSAYKDELLKKINKSLGLVAFIGSNFFFLVYKKMLSFYLSSWMVNIGYPFLFGCIMWALIAVWIAELIKIDLQEVAHIPYQSDEKILAETLTNLKTKSNE